MVELESNKLFRELLPGELEHLREATREMTFAAQQRIFRQGDPGDGFYFIKKEGLVQISTTVSSGDSKVLSMIGVGDLFGEMAVLDSDPRSATPSPTSRRRFYFITRGEMIKLLDRTPRLAAALVREISRRLRTFNDQYVREVFEAERLQLVGRFASSIVHDIKNPLNIIGISADMACMPSSTLESRQVAKVRIRKQVERISNMVIELMVFTQGSHTEFRAGPDVLQIIQIPMNDRARKSGRRSRSNRGQLGCGAPFTACCVRRPQHLPRFSRYGQQQ